MATLQHQNIDLAYMHAPAAINFLDDPAVFVPPRAGFLYYHVPSGTTWKSTGTTTGAVEIAGYSPAFKVVEKSADYRLDAEVFDYGRDACLFVDSSSPAVVTVPASAELALPIGYRLAVHQAGVGSIQIVAADGVTISATGALAIALQFNFGTLLKVGVNSWRFLLNGVGGGASIDSILTDPATGSVLVDSVTGNVLTS